LEIDTHRASCGLRLLALATVDALPSTKSIAAVASLLILAPFVHGGRRRRAYVSIRTTDLRAGIFRWFSSIGAEALVTAQRGVQRQRARCLDRHREREPRFAIYLPCYQTERIPLN